MQTKGSFYDAGLSAEIGAWLILERVSRAADLLCLFVIGVCDLACLFAMMLSVVMTPVGLPTWRRA